MFLSEDEMVDLTGIGAGRSGRTKHELQVSFLKSCGIPFILNTRGRPIVSRAYFEAGRMATAAPIQKQSWQPGVM
ncbi:DUF4224 domain-containing protein [Limnobacter sp.]|uniref:DUF4224 domain-containing protein n=1 Tax=Limnobacter sp. TaxID=2003368 RepID=UPI0039C94CE1